MMQTLACEEFAGPVFVERYLAQKLSPEELEAFEAHFLTCEHCQNSLVLGAGIRAALPKVSRAPPRRTWLIWGGGLGLAAAAGLAGILLIRPERPPESLTRLGELIQAPVYLGIPVRAGPSATGDSLFEAGMTAYGREQFSEAVAGLRGALATGVDSVPAEFFLAASLLMTGQAVEAAAGYGRVIAHGDTPYLAEAHFYRAKALLRLGQAAAALAELRQSAQAGGVIGSSARALADSVERAIQR